MRKNSNNKAQNTPIIATIVVAALALAAVIVLIVILSGSGKENTPSQQEEQSEVFLPTAEFEQECEYAAHDLVKGNYEIVRLFVTQGLPHLDEPYGNAPEDGVYTVNTEKSRGYSSLEDIENKVKSFYTDEAADKILHNVDGNGLEVYKNRTILVDDPSSAENAPQYKEEVVLGISADFKADTEYESLWESCSLSVLPTSETECSITIYLGDAKPDTSVTGTGKILNTKMVKNGAEWRLTEFVY